MRARTGALLLLALPALAAPSASAAQPIAGTRLAPPLELPPRASAEAGRSTPWIVGARRHPGVDALARRFGARRILRRAPVYRLDRGAAGFAAALRRRGLLAFAERDRRASTSALPSDPLTPYQFGVRASVDPGLTPPPVTSGSPLLVDVDTQIDLTHPEFAGGNTSAAYTNPPTDSHGTAVAAVAGAPANGVGIIGVWPGMRVRNRLTDLSCSDIVHEVEKSIDEHASVINLSFGGDFCYAEYVADQLAFGAGAVLVASAGNEFEQGNAPEYPASYPHVVSVAAVDDQDQSPGFSEENAGIDLSAAGVGVLTAVPPAFDDDGRVDGYALLNGTSFSSPIVAAAAAWVRARRPRLAAGQVGAVLDDSARDLGPRGWDQRFGYGRLDLGAALRDAAPAPQPFEPNDDVGFVNGTLFRGADPFLFTGRRAVRIRDRLDQWEDPGDVFRVSLPARSGVRVRLVPAFGDPDLVALDSRARSLYAGSRLNRAHLVASSARNGRAVDSVVVHNRGRRSRRLFVATTIASSVHQLDAGYRLELTRLRR